MRTVRIGMRRRMKEADESVSEGIHLDVVDGVLDCIGLAVAGFDQPWLRAERS